MACAAGPVKPACALQRGVGRYAERLVEQQEAVDRPVVAYLVHSGAGAG
jgi:hypothetical protein